jgi:hypothetical protein
LFAETIVREALSGNAPFVKEVLERLDGKVVHRVGLEGLRFPARGV